MLPPTGRPGVTWVLPPPFDVAVKIIRFWLAKRVSVKLLSLKGWHLELLKKMFLM